jgi:hypothetical protein
MKPEFNINPIAGSRLGSEHTQDTKVKMSVSKSGINNPIFGKIGENNHLFGKIHSIE